MKIALRIAVVIAVVAGCGIAGHAQPSPPSERVTATLDSSLAGAA